MTSVQNDEQLKSLNTDGGSEMSDVQQSAEQVVRELSVAAGASVSVQHSKDVSIDLSGGGNKPHVQLTISGCFGMPMRATYERDALTGRKTVQSITPVQIDRIALPIGRKSTCVMGCGRQFTAGAGLQNHQRFCKGLERNRGVQHCIEVDEEGETGVDADVGEVVSTLSSEQGSPSSRLPKSLPSPLLRDGCVVRCRR